MLATQIAVAQATSMRFAKILARENLPISLEMYERMYNKTARTLAAQFEALKRYRIGGEQKITVQHVQNMQNVAVDGPAIVGNVTHAGSRAAAEPVASGQALTHDPQPTMPVIDQPELVSVPARARARRKANK